MNYIEKLKTKLEPECTEVDGEKVYVCRLSSSQKDQFDIHWAAYRKKTGSKGVGLRAFVVAFCLCDESGIREFDSGEDESPSQEFVDSLEQFLNADAGLIEPVFEKAATVNGIIEGSEKN